MNDFNGRDRRFGAIPAPAAPQRQSADRTFACTLCFTDSFIDTPGATPMKAFATIGIGSLGSISFQHAIRTSGADRPYGIAADSWVRLDDNLGLVITSRGPAATGYFMLKHDNIWQRLTIETKPAATAPTDA